MAEDGRGPSIWDTFTARPGHRARRTATARWPATPTTGYEEDLDLVAGTGRRVVPLLDRLAAGRSPTGSRRGSRARGLDYYDRLVDAALARGVAPTATLYHWDLPQPLEDRGGWLEPRHRRGVRRLRDDRPRPARRPGAASGRPTTSRGARPTSGTPPACTRRAGARAAPPTGPRTTCCSGTAWPPRGCTRPAPPTSGIVLNLAPFWPEDAREAGWRPPTASTRIRNRVWLGPLVDGAYDERLLARRARAGRPAQSSATATSTSSSGSADWLGVNYYTPFRTAAADAGATPHPEADAYPGRPTRVVRGPRAAHRHRLGGRRRAACEELLVDTHRRTGLPLLVTENGAAYPDDATSRRLGGHRRRPGPHRLPARPHRRRRAGP